MTDLGKNAHRIIQAAIDAGDPVPEDLIGPELDEGYRFAYEAFNALSTDRQVGFGVGPIPWSAIDQFAQRYGIVDIDEFERLNYLIRVMDGVYLEDAAAKAKSKK